MVIRFTCPNGHRLSSPDDTVGRSGKCPQCGSLFKVPAVSTDSGKGSDTKTPADEKIIEFLCPNGHHLEGPERLAGRGGQCPHCGMRFQIPTLDEIAASEELPEDDQEVEEVEEVDAPPELQEQESAEQDVPAETEEAGPPPSFDFIDPEAGLDAEPQFDHAMARLFEALWDGSEPEAVVEVYLTDGKVVAPQHYSHALSRGKHAIFGTLEPDGTQMVTVVPWDLVSRVIVRGLRELPEGMFD